jgi:ribosomal-protein-alanine N-acetyltransferase
MAFLRVTLTGDTEPEVHGRGLTMRTPQMSDYGAWASIRAASRDHLTPWEPQWGPDDLSRLAFRHRLKQYQRDLREDANYALFMFRDADQALLGGITLSNVRRGVSQAASLGYWIGAHYAGRGYMTEAVRALLPYAFDVLRLHRIEAACLPQNAASIRVLEKNGFKSEGLARRYLKINGQWQDHLLFARLEDDPRGERLSA